jgi:hypothetical protein
LNPTRVARNLSTVAVAAVAAWSSWSHMVHVALRFGERPEVAYVLPISVDGMLIVASTAMVDDRRAARPVRWSARISFLAGDTDGAVSDGVGEQPGEVRQQQGGAGCRVGFGPADDRTVVERLNQDVRGCRVVLGAGVTDDRVG